MAKPDNNIVVESGGASYRCMTLPDFIEFRKLALSEGPEWYVHYSDAKLIVESKPPGDKSTSLNILRAKRLMPKVPPEVLYNQLHDATYRTTWDDSMIEGFNIVQLDPHNDVGYYSARFPFPLANRDFCNMRSWMEFDNGEYVIFNHSVPHSTCPVKKQFVRARSILTGYLIQPHSSGGTMLTYVTHSDPCGSIPHMIINMATTRLVPKLLNKCEQCSQEYPAFAAKTYEPTYVFPWRTPKMNWDSTFLYPEHELAAQMSAAKADGEKAADAEGVAPQDRAARESPAAADGETEEGAEAALALGGQVPSSMAAVSLAPVAASSASHALALQQYRALMQDAMNAVDRSFLREGRVPTTKEYVTRLRYTVEGIRETM